MQCGDVFGVYIKVDIGDFGYCGDYCLVFFKVFCMVQVGDIFFGQDVGDVIIINYYWCQWYVGGFCYFNCIQCFNEGWFYVGLEGFDYLYYQFFFVLYWVWFGDYIELCWGGVVVIVWVVVYVWCVVEVGKMVVGDG